MWSGNSWQFFGGSGPIEYLHYHQKSYLQNIVKSCSSSLWMVIPPTDLWVGVWMVKTTLPYNGQVFQKSQETTVHHMLVCRLCHTYFISQRINTFNVWWSVLKMLRDVNRKQYRHWNQNILDIYIYINVTMYQLNCVSQNEADKNIDMSFAGLEILFHETLSLQVVVPSTFVVSVGLLPDSDGRGLGVLPNDVFCTVIDWDSLEI